MVTLQAFIEQALTEITDGLLNFADARGGTGASPNPDGLTPASDPKGRFLKTVATGNDRFGETVVSVEFDIAVTAEESSTKKGGVGLAVASVFRGEIGKESETVATSVSRIRFPVPLRLPKVGAKGVRGPRQTVAYDDQD